MTDDTRRDTAMEQAMRWLARREYSVQELAHRLTGKGFSHDAVAAALDALQARGLLSDRRFAESLCRNRVERGYGPLKIAHELRAKGVDGALVDELLDGDDERWLARLRELWHQRFGVPPDSYREWARQARSLQSRGFTADQVRRVIPDIES